MLWTLGVILLILWLLGLMIGYTMGGFIQRGGGWRDESISGCGLAGDHTPRPGLKRLLFAHGGLH